MLFFVIVSIFLQLQASTLGLLDSGADANNDLLSKHLLINSLEQSGRTNFDDDRNGYVDDSEGWNFIEENPFPFDENLYGNFGEVFYKYYEIREKKALETWSAKEKAWYLEKRKDDEFLEQLKKFRSYIHATHVAGIALKPENKQFGSFSFINVKYLGSPEKGLAKEPEYSPLKKGSIDSRIIHLKKFITKYNKWQEGKLSRAIEYVCQSSDVVNASWGKSWKSSLLVVEGWYKKEFNEAPDQKLNEELARLFLSNLIQTTEKIAMRYPHILFVFSAGNTGSNNDDYPHYPSNARGDNILAVGASNLDQRTSSSNFGLKQVDLFAPGFLIESETPENRKIKTTGTSQAAPAVSHAALILKNINPRLSAKDLKKLILRTVDLSKEFICVSGGELNLKRTIMAGQFSLKNSIENSTDLAWQRIPQKTYPKTAKPLRTQDDPLPEPF